MDAIVICDHKLGNSFTLYVSVFIRPGIEN
jgi:hypothetical protein